MEPELKDLLSFLFQRADATQTFWNFYAGAITAVLGLVTAGKPAWLTRSVCFGITAAFLVFAAGNLWALDSIRTQREELVNVAKLVQGYSRVENVVAAVRPPAKWGLRGFHGVLDVGAVAAIWAIPWSRRRSERGRRSGGGA